MRNDSKELPPWRRRWEAAIRKHVKDTKREKPKGSLSKISLRAGLAKSYVSNTLKKTSTEKLTLEAFIAVCNAIGVSPGGILMDVEIRPVDEEIVRLLENAAAEDKDYALSVLRRAVELRARTRER